MNNHSPRHTPRVPLPSRNVLPWSQWVGRLNEYLPAAYVRAYREHLRSLWADGCTVGEAFAYARAYLTAPTVCPAGWEFVEAQPAPDMPDASALPRDLRSLLDDLRLDSEL